MIKATGAGVLPLPFQFLAAWVGQHAVRESLRKIVVGRKAWMFYGSDTHAGAAAAIFSAIASCRLHRLDPFTYLEEILRVLPYWPRDRYLELAPKYWLRTRGRLRLEELAAPLSAFEIPAEDASPARTHPTTA